MAAVRTYTVVKCIILCNAIQNDPFHWCSFIGQQDLSAPPSAMDSSGTYSAVFPCGVNLWKKREVTVAFTYESYKYFGKWRVNTKKILILANRWHEQQKEPNYIPRFVVCPDLDEADIIVELNGNNKLCTMHYTSNYYCPIITL